MKLFIEPALAARFPDYRMFTVFATGIDNSGDPEGRLAGPFEDAVRQIREGEDLGSVVANARIAAWREAFRQTGVDPDQHRPSLEALVHRLLEGQKINLVNQVVALSNLTSLRHMLPCGGDDLGKVEGDFGLAISTGLETFLGIGATEESHPEPGEVVYRDEQKILCRRWIWRQGETSKITRESRNVAVNVDVLPPATVEEGRAAAEELAALIREHCGGSTEIVVIGGGSNSVTIPTETTALIFKERLRSTAIRRLLDERNEALSDSSDMSKWCIQDILLRGNVEQIVVEHDFLNRLGKDEPITIYQGFDPTSPHLHVGHLVSLRVLRWFQQHGHRVIFLLGDATALVGDPSGRSEQRKMLTPEQVAANMATYKQQAARLLDFEGHDNPVVLLRNSEWLLPLKLADLLRLMSEVTVQRLLERDMFQVRIKKEEPLYYVETLYPLLQGYDSVAMEVDAELGGRDQLYNMLMGRDLSKSYLQKDKFVLTTPLLAGFDGRKMSKTYGNTVDLTAAPFDLFDGIMQVRDDLILTYASLLTDIRWSDLAELEASLHQDPLAVKERVAFELVRSLHGETESEAAHREFIEVRREGANPKEMLRTTVPGEPPEGLLVDYLGKASPPLGVSKAELRRLFRQGGIYLSGRRITDEHHRVENAKLDGQVLRLGKKRYFKLAVG